MKGFLRTLKGCLDTGVLQRIPRLVRSCARAFGAQKELNNSNSEAGFLQRIKRSGRRRIRSSMCTGMLSCRYGSAGNCAKRKQHAGRQNFKGRACACLCLVFGPWLRCGGGAHPPWQQSCAVRPGRSGGCALPTVSG